MAYQVIARKWRPQSFHDLVGQEHISTTLLNALRSQRLPQALLFTGVRGTGKTSSARILAKSLRCTNSKDFVPCGLCRDCEDIAGSRSLDVIEIDGASNNGVDAIRELRETVGYMPSSGQFKIYIIDEVHMLSTSAFNALLKTLEEPPAHVIFIMATTEAQKIPNTILSRCQRFDFRRIASRQIAAQLTKICDAENVKTEPEAVWLIARQADGSMRDSQSLLDQVITFSGGELTLAKAIDVLGLTDRTVLLETVSALVTRDTAKTVEVIEKIFKAGYDAKVFAQDLLEELRNTLLVRLCPDDPTRVVDLPDVEIQNLRDITQTLSDEDIHLLFDMCLKGVNDILRSQDARIVLEMLLLRMAAAPRVASLAALAAGQPLPVIPRAITIESRVQTTASIANSGPMPTKAAASQSSLSDASSSPASSSTHSSSATSAPSLTAEAQTSPSAPNLSAQSAEKPKYSMASFVRPAGSPPGTPMPVTAAAEKKSASAPAALAPKAEERDSKDREAETPVDPARASDPWFRFVSLVKQSNSLLGAMLENTHLISQDANALVVGVPRRMSFMLDKVKEAENVKRIETFLETFWHKKYTVEIKLADEKAEKVSPKTMVEEQKAAKQRSIEQAVEQNPLVQTAQNVFKTQIKSIKDAGKRGT